MAAEYLSALDGISKLSVAIFGFYLIIFCNFTKELPGCRLQNTLDNNMYAKHFIGFILLFFLVIMVDQDNMEKNLMYNIFYSIIIYALFLLTTRVSFPFMVVILLLLLLCYIITSIAKKRKDDKKDTDHDMLIRIRNIIFLIIIATIMIGFGLYSVEKYREYGKQFSFTKFILGKPKCRNYTPSSAKLF